MTITREQYDALTVRLSKEHRDARDYHLNAQAEVGRKAETALQHEGYEVFRQHLTSIRDAVEAKQKASMVEMTRAVGEKLVEQQMAWRELEGERRGLTAALDMLPKLVEAGQRAVEMLKGEAS